MTELLKFKKFISLLDSERVLTSPGQAYGKPAQYGTM